LGDKMAFDFVKRKNNSGRVNNQAKSGNSNYSPFGSKQAFGKSTTVAAQGGAAQTGASAAAKKKQAMQGAVGTGATPGSAPQKKQNLFSPTSKASPSTTASSASSTLGGGVGSGGMSGVAPASTTNYSDYKKQIDSLLSGTGGGIGAGGLSGQTSGATQGSVGARTSGAGTGTPVQGDGGGAGFDVEDTPTGTPEEGGEQGAGAPFTLEQGPYQWGDEYDQYGQDKTWEYGVGNQIQQYQRGLNEELGDSWYDYQQQWFDQAAPAIPDSPDVYNWHSRFGIGPANPHGSPAVQDLFDRWLRANPNATEEEIEEMKAIFSQQFATPGGIGGFSSDKWRELEFGNYGMGSHSGNWGDPEDWRVRGYQGGESELLNKVFHMNIGPDSAFADKDLVVSRIYQRAFNKPIIDWDEDLNPIYGSSPFETMKWRLNAPETEEVYATWKNLWGVTDEDIDQLRNIREDQIGTHWNKAMADDHEEFLRGRLDLIRSKPMDQLLEEHPGMFIVNAETGEVSVSHWTPHHTAQILLDEPITFRGKRLIGEIQIEESMPEEGEYVARIVGGFGRPDRDELYPGMPKMSYINADGDRIYIVEGPHSVWGGDTQNILSHHPKTGEPIVTGPDPRMDEANWEEFSWTSKFINLPPNTGENILYVVRPWESLEDAMWYAESWLNAYEMAKQSGGGMGEDVGGGMGGDMGGMGGDMGGGDGFIPGIDS
tara:strand:+ start:1725 stop:3857 length:2133 start_codon:yes stop_codon:yes gene_type:complete